MGETSHAKLLWAIIAPLAALAGVAWIHFKRKQKDSMIDNGRTVRKVTRQLDPKKQDSVNNKTDINNAAATNNCSTNDEVIQKDITICQSTNLNPETTEVHVDSTQIQTQNTKCNSPSAECTSHNDKMAVEDQPRSHNDDDLDCTTFQVNHEKVDTIDAEELLVDEPIVQMSDNCILQSCPDIPDAEIDANVEPDQVAKQATPDLVENDEIASDAVKHDEPAPQATPALELSSEDIAMTSDSMGISNSTDQVEDDSEDEFNIHELSKPDNIDNNVDSGFKTMTMEEPVSTESVPVDDSETETQQDEYDPYSSDKNEDRDFEYEIVEVQTAPGRLTADFVEGLEPIVRSTNSAELDSAEFHDPKDQSYDIIIGASLGLEETTCSDTIEPDTGNMLSAIEEITEDKVSAPLSAIPSNMTEFGLSGGTSGSDIADSISRTRTDSERIEEADWTNSPIMKLKNTPVLDDIRPRKDGTTRAGSDDRKRPSKLRMNKKNLKSRIEACEDDRDSTTTPDSTKETASSHKRAKKPKRKDRNRKKKKSAESKETSESTATNEESEVKDGTSSDSGTHTDDNVERYMEISGFPADMIGALIGKRGKSIQSLQAKSRCKILIKDYPVEDGGQYISIEGTRKNINKACSIIREKFPEIKMSQMEQSAQADPSLQSPEFYPQTLPNDNTLASEYENMYDYNEIYMGSINNLADQIDLVEGVPVEVRVTSLGPSYNELWLQPYTHPSHDKFARLEASMSDFYSRDTEQSIMTTYLELGQYAMCLHHSPDEHTGKDMSKWYRVQIIQYPDDLTATVLYLDFGGYASVPIEMLRKIMQEFLPQSSRCPFQAIHAELCGLLWNSKFEADKLPEVSVHLHDIICKAPPNSFEAEVVRYDHYNNRPMVKLSYNTTQKKFLVNKMIADQVNMLDYQTTV